MIKVYDLEDQVETLTESLKKLEKKVIIFITFLKIIFSKILF